jgi:hypothetical protein
MTALTFSTCVAWGRGRERGRGMEPLPGRIQGLKREAGYRICLVEEVAVDG